MGGRKEDVGLKESKIKELDESVGSHNQNGARWR